MLLMVLGIVSRAWVTAGLRYFELAVATFELRNIHANHVQRNALWLSQIESLESRVAGLHTVLNEPGGVSAQSDTETPSRYIAVSLNERWLELREDDAVIWGAPVAIGRGWSDDVQSERRFSTPRGRR